VRDPGTLGRVAPAAPQLAHDRQRARGRVIPLDIEPQQGVDVERLESEALTPPPTFRTASAADLSGGAGVERGGIVGSPDDVLVAEGVDGREVPARHVASLAFLQFPA
jgi:hypothetical protein